MKNSKVLYFVITFLLFTVISCSDNNKDTNKNEIQKPVQNPDFKLISSAFENAADIPEKYTCNGENISPPLKWNNVSPKIKSYALILDDPDVPLGDFVHWIMFNIPSSVTDLPENFTGNYPMGKNGFRKEGYSGPCPPIGTHRYFFKLFALDSEIDLNSGISKSELLNAMQGHIIAQTELMGKYKRN